MKHKQVQVNSAQSGWVLMEKGGGVERVEAGLLWAKRTFSQCVWWRTRKKNQNSREGSIWEIVSVKLSAFNYVTKILKIQFKADTRPPTVHQQSSYLPSNYLPSIDEIKPNSIYLNNHAISRLVIDPPYQFSSHYAKCATTPREI